MSLSSTSFGCVLLAMPGRIISLSFPDMLIIVLYFAMVLGIGIYLRGYANTSKDFFLAGREMSSWVAGLSFLSANMGALELMGWAAAAYQYGLLAAHFYWIAAFPAMVFLGLVMMPFYYISKTHSVPATCNCVTASRPGRSVAFPSPS
jgi:SSS family solute:Na+ symporter